jgi:arginase
MKPANPGATEIALIGAASSAGARKAGQERAPQALRDAGLVQSLEGSGHDVLDWGDIDVVTFSEDLENPNQQNLDRVVGALQQVERRVDESLADEKWPLIIGGDCTISIGVLAALNRHYRNLGMIYLDGDVDLNTPDTTLTGILDGMVLAHVLGNGAGELSHFGGRHPQLDEENVVLFGYSTEAGGIDPVETDQLEVTSMAKYPLEAVTSSAQEAATRAINDLGSKVDHILVHFDVDVIDAGDFPAADVLHSPGLSIDQARDALAVFLASEKTVGLVVTEFNASMDKDGSLARRLVDLIVNADAQGNH